MLTTLSMSRRFTIVSVALVAVVAFLVGAILAGGFEQPTLVADTESSDATSAEARILGRPPSVPMIDFADVVERINPAVVSIDASARDEAGPGGYQLPRPTPPRNGGGSNQSPRRGAGTGFIIDPDGSILTNHHVIEGAERIMVTLSDGRALRARVVGADPDTDIALLKVNAGDGRPFPVAPVGDSSAVRMGEWVCAIGNPLGYEHSVTVGVVSFVGRKLFDASLDNYIQTDAAINLGNSGGPLINARGEVIGINSAISSRGSSIGFAVPISGAVRILPQLRAHGRVSRGFIGVALRDVNADLEESLSLAVSAGAMVQDVSSNSPAERAGVRPYDVIVGFGDETISSDEELITAISSKSPGTTSTLHVWRGEREETLTVKLAERPLRAATGDNARPEVRPRPMRDTGQSLGLTVRDLDANVFDRLDLPRDTRGVLITGVEPLSASFDARVQLNSVILEINRQPVPSADDYRRIAEAAQPGEVLALYVYAPEVDQRQIKTVRLEAR